jgi:hypothetical protein
MESESNTDYQYEYDFDSFHSIIKYIRNHYLQIIMLFAVFIIIFIIDYISNINIILFGPPPTLTLLNANNNNTINDMKNKKLNNKNKKINLKK